jgi:hypothetical protein
MWGTRVCGRFGIHGMGEGIYNRWICSLSDA